MRGMEVSALALGSGRLLHAPRPRKWVARKNLLRLALELGINFFDTADSYASGVDELFLGTVFRHHRRRIVIATKAGNLGSPLHKLRNKVRHKLRRGAARQCFEAGYIRRCLESSLRRLRTDHVDVFYLHSPPLEVLSAGESYHLLQQLKAEGKARAVGVACRQLNDFFALPHQRLDVVQLPFDQHHQRLTEARKICRQFGIGLVLRQPFAGKARYDAQRPNQQPLPMADWLRWLMGKYSPDTILFGTSSTANLQQNVMALAADAQGTLF